MTPSTPRLPIDEDEDRVGVPSMGIAPPLPTRRPEPVPPDEVLREGETGLGRPEQLPLQQRALTNEDRKLLLDEEARLEADELDRINQ